MLSWINRCGVWSRWVCFLFILDFHPERNITFLFSCLKFCEFLQSLKLLLRRKTSINYLPLYLSMIGYCWSFLLIQGLGFAMEKCYHVALEYIYLLFWFYVIFGRSQGIRWQVLVLSQYSLRHFNKHAGSAR